MHGDIFNIFYIIIVCLIQCQVYRSAFLGKHKKTGAGSPREGFSVILYLSAIIYSEVLRSSFFNQFNCPLCGMPIAHINILLLKIKNFLLIKSLRNM